MAASQNDKFMYVGSPGTATTLSSPGYTTGVSTGITVGTTASFPTLTGCIFAIDTVEVISGEEVQVAGTYTVYSGTVTNGTTIGNVTLLYGTAQSYAAGSLTRVYIPISSLHTERLIQGLLAEHKQLDGTHSDINADSLSTDTITEKTAANGVTVDGLNIKDGKLNTASSVVTSNYTDGSVANAALAAGVSVQTACDIFTAVATGAETIPLDDTVPQITEGKEYMTVTIIPKSATNILLIDASALLASDAAAFNMIGAIFQDTTAGALVADTFTGTAASANGTLLVKHKMVAGTTSATIFRFRAGANTGTTTFNGRAAGRLFGGITKSCFSVTEYKA